jgi:alpha-glucosidase
MELAAFTPIFRTHEGITPGENHQFYDDPESMERFAKFAKVYASLAFYRKELAHEAAETGMPMVRHPFLHYPDDVSARHITFEQFMLGADFMIAPVFDPGETTVNLYLPAGSWTHLWTGHVFGDPGNATRITIMAPLGEPAVFYKTGSAAGEQFRENLRASGVL